MIRLLILAAMLAAATAGTAAAISVPPGNPRLWLPPPPPATDCTPHGGVADAIDEERTIDGNVYAVTGVRCNDGTEFVYDKVYVGAAPALNVGLTFAGAELTDESGSAPADETPVDCGPYWSGESSDPWPGGC